MKLRRKDQVVVLAGRDRGKTGEVERIIPATQQIVVNGVNMAKRHTKPSSKNPRGGILDITRPMPVAKVALVCPSCKKPTRIGYIIKGDNKERICRKCQAVVGS